MEEKNTIGYIDESQDEIYRFQRFAKNNFIVRTYTLEANTTLDSLWKEVEASQVSALVVDYDLKEGKTISFNGDEVIDKVREHLPFFPVIILTSHEGDALGNMDDVELIFEKELMSNAESKAELIKRIKRKIISYENKVKRSEERMLSLIHKQQTEVLSPKEEEELIELDDFIEKTISAKNKIPKDWKKQDSDLKKMTQLAEEILKELKK